MSVIRPEADTKEQETPLKDMFANRDAVERDILLKNHDRVDLEMDWRGKDYIDVPRWTVKRLYESEQALTSLVSKMDPKLTLNLFIGTRDNQVQSIYEIFNLWFGQIGKEIEELVCVTLQLKDEEIDEFIDTISPADLLSIFEVIISNSLTNPRLRAILKKALDTMFEKSALADVSQNSLDYIPPTLLT